MFFEILELSMCSVVICHEPRFCYLTNQGTHYDVCLACYLGPVIFALLIVPLFFCGATCTLLFFICCYINFLSQRTMNFL